MVSVALSEWRGQRSAHIDDLLFAHQRIGGTGAGRRWRTEQLNWALVLRVAAEFQGFSRALHDEASDYFAAQAGQLNAVLQGIVLNRMTAGRKIDSGNAGPGNLGSDFDRLGMQFWPDLKAKYPAKAPKWNKTMAALNDARNAIAHDDQVKLAELTSEGWALSQLATIRTFRGAADSLASGMDTVVGNHLQRLFGGGLPW